MGSRLTVNDVDRACVEVLDAHREEYTWQREEVAGVVFYTVYQDGVELGRWRISPGTERAPSVRWSATSAAVRRGACHALETGYLPEDEAERHQRFVELTRRVKEHIEFVHLIGPHWGEWYEEWKRRNPEWAERQHGARRGAPPLEERIDAEAKREAAREYLALRRKGVKAEVAADRVGYSRRTLDSWVERFKLNGGEQG